MTGLLTEPDFSLASARFQVFLVNRRVVADRILGAVLKAVFAGLLPRGRHPAAVLHLTLPAPDLDVNVHPAKTEVRFQDPGRVYSLPPGGPAPGPGAALRVRPPPTPGHRPARAPPRVAEASLSDLAGGPGPGRLAGAAALARGPPAPAPRPPP